MRLRTFVGLVAMFTFAGSILTASSASAYQLMEPAGMATSTSATDVVVAATTATPCPSSGASIVDGPLPKLGADLQAGLAAYAKNPSGGNVDGWIDSGGRFGGGVPASAVRTLMRRGLAVRPHRRAGAELPPAGIPPRHERSPRRSVAVRLHR